MSLRARAVIVVVAATAIPILGACSPGLSFESGAASSAATGAPSTGGAGANGPATGSGGDGASTPASSGSGGDGGAGGDSGASASTAGPGTTASVASTGTGADCAEAADCHDANPCTVDTCSQGGLCISVAVEPGEAGNAGEGSCPVGVCQLDATCGLQVYSHTFDPAGADPTWSRTTISEMFGVDEGAPPFTGIREIVPLRSLGLLAVFADVDGANMLYLRTEDGSWRTPMIASAYLPELPDDIRCGYAYQPVEADAGMVVVLSGPGEAAELQQAYSYTVSGMGDVTPDPANPIDVDRTDEAGSPPPNGELCRWSFAVQTGFLGDPSWVVAWDGTGANVYHFDGGTGTWTNYGADTGSPVWAAAGMGPSTQSVVAAWFEEGIVHLVAP